MKNNRTKPDTRDIAYIALFAAVMSVLSQISLPMPGGVPVTLQTFGAALVGYMLGAKKGAVSMAVYMLLGAAGAPVFAGFHGGFGSVVGQSGGFIWGFIPMAFLCGLGAQIGSGLPGSSLPTAAKIASGSIRTIPGIGKAALAAVPGLLGLAVCHFCGVMQWTAVRGGGVFGSFLTVSAPFLLKDIVSTMSAYFVSVAVKKRVRTFIDQKPAGTDKQ